MFCTLTKSILKLYVSGTGQADGKVQNEVSEIHRYVFLIREQRYTSLVTLKTLYKVVFSFPSVTRIMQVQVRTPNKLTCSPGHPIITEKRTHKVEAM